MRSRLELGEKAGKDQKVYTYNRAERVAGSYFSAGQIEGYTLRK